MRQVTTLLLLKNYYSPSWSPMHLDNQVPVINRKHYALALAFALMTVFGLGGTANAQGRPEAPDGWQVSLGVGVLNVPNYLGDDQNQTIAVPSVRATYSNTWVMSVREGIQYTVNPEASWQYGVAISPRFGRDAEDENPFRIAGDGTNDLVGLDDIDTQAEFRAFTKYSLGAWSINASVNQTFTGDDQRRFELGVSRSGIVMTGGPPLIVSAGASLRYGNSTTLRRLVGVTPEEASLSGLNPYSPDAGLIAYSLNATIILPLTRSLSLLSILSIQHVGDEIEQSSLVSERGDSVQSTAGLFLNYKLGAEQNR